MTSEESSSFKTYLLDIVTKEKVRISRLSSMDMQNLVRKQIFSRELKVHKPSGNIKNNQNTFLCVDCGDRFLFQSSYQFHTNRQSVKITYNCRICQQTLIYDNRCNLLKHVRSHMQHSNTLNLIDIKIEPLTKETSMKVFYNTYESEDVTKDVSATETENDLRANVQDSITSPVRNHSPNYFSATTSEHQPRDLIEGISSPVPNCYECLLDFNHELTVDVARALHYKDVINARSYKCSLCKITLPNICSLKAHMRLHHLKPPLICPSCGHEYENINDFISITSHPCSHMYKKVYLECNVPRCLNLMPEEDYYNHQINVHMKLIYKCSTCSVACFTREAISIHAKSQHKIMVNPLSFYQCVLCPGRLVPQSCLAAHINTHKRNADRQQVFVCYKCEVIFRNEVNVLNHALVCKHQFISFSISTDLAQKQKQRYKVKKKCNLCQNSFMYSCLYTDISSLPTKCPYCFETSNKVDGVSNVNGVNENQSLCSTKKDTVKCHICKVFINIGRDAVKDHYMNNHKDHNFIDIVPIVEKLDLSGHQLYSESFENSFQSQRKRNILENNKEMLRGRKRKSKKKKKLSMIPFSSGVVVSKEKAFNGNLTCTKCSFSTDCRQDFKGHLITHRNMSTAYQCMECGLCFVVKPSFATHLFISHGIGDVDEYINKENLCKIVSDSEEALSHDKLYISGPLLENQCKICLEQFNSEDDLEKHFRVHGMAFLLSKTNNSKATENS